MTLQACLLRLHMGLSKGCDCESLLLKAVFGVASPQSPCCPRLLARLLMGTCSWAPCVGLSKEPAPQGWTLSSVAASCQTSDFRRPRHQQKSRAVGRQSEAVAPKSMESVCQGPVSVRRTWHEHRPPPLSCSDRLP